MPSYAHIHILGYLGKDPVLDEKTEAARFSVAHTHKRKAGDITTWYAVTAWRQTAKVCAQWLKKGDLVGIVGRPYMDQWTGNDGKVLHTLKIDATEVILMGKSDTTTDTERLTPVKPVTPLPPRTPVGVDDEPPF